MSVCTPVTRPSSVSSAVTLALLHPQVFLSLRVCFIIFWYSPPVGLGPEGPDRRALAPVEHPVLDAGQVGGLPHLTPQGVQLPGPGGLARAADGGGCRACCPPRPG